MQYKSEHDGTSIYAADRVKEAVQAVCQLGDTDLQAAVILTEVSDQIWRRTTHCAQADTAASASSRFAGADVEAHSHDKRRARDDSDRRDSAQPEWHEIDEHQGAANSAYGHAEKRQR